MQIRTVKTIYQVQYRLNGFWYPLQDFKSKMDAENYVNSSSACQNNGFQVVKLTKQFIKDHK